MRKKLVAGNWKMHGSRTMAAALVDELAAAKPASIDVNVFPPFPYLAELAAQHRDSGIGFGAQDLSEHEGQGAFTGEVSGAMLADVGARWVLVGHSERRQYHHEDNELVARKFAAARAAGLTPILCVGETLQQREADATESVIAAQLQAVLRSSGIASFDTAVIAYEPVWAIGTGETATPGQARQAHAVIKELLEVPVLYGGSVKPENAEELLSQEGVDGALVGGASLDVESFTALCWIAANL